MTNEKDWPFLKGNDDKINDEWMETYAETFLYSYPGSFVTIEARRGNDKLLFEVRQSKVDHSSSCLYSTNRSNLTTKR